MSEPMPRPGALRDGFSSQMPIAALFFAAVAGIVAVNVGSPPAAPARPAAEPSLDRPATPLAPTPDARDPAADCPDCGRVIAVDHPTPYHREAAVAALRESVVRVRFADGTVRRFRQLAPDVRVGDRVRIEEGALRATL